MLAEAFERIDPALKMHEPREGRIEKWALRALFDGTHARGLEPRSN